MVESAKEAINFLNIENDSITNITTFEQLDFTNTFLVAYSLDFCQLMVNPVFSFVLFI